MTHERDIAVTVNGREVRRRVEPRLLLSDFLRHELGLTGTHVGCEHGVCGACTVLIDGDSVRAASCSRCRPTAVRHDGRGARHDRPSLSPLQRGVPRRTRAAMRLLHARHADDRRPTCSQQVSARDRRGDPRGPLRQSLPLHRLPAHRRRDAQRRRKARRARHEDARHLGGAPAAAGAISISQRRSAARRSTCRCRRYLLRHPQGNVMFDTGCHPSVGISPDEGRGALGRPCQDDDADVAAARQRASPVSNASASSPTTSTSSSTRTSIRTIAAAMCSSARRRSSATRRNSRPPNRAERERASAISPAEWDHPNPIQAIEARTTCSATASSSAFRCRATRPARSARWSISIRRGSFLLASDSVSLRADLDTRPASRKTPGTPKQLDNIVSRR